ncbi:aminotransferase class I/II-fold pyridoxal phosphate-dependent enzyme [Intrasporangium sp.]|jgi:cystathionine beta-lyase|uniref:MalY/PatB family protein n=1 Tax=Intrasporangium sp. TaxID=1925024 RepID=UPI0033653044
MTDRILTAPADELRRSRTSLKWRTHPSDVLPLWVAEMDCEPCPAVVEAVSDAMRRGDTGYPWTRDYTEAFASFAATEWNWQVDPGSGVVVADVLSGIARLLEVLTDPAAPVVLSSPVYNAFFTVIDSIGRKPLDAPLTADGRLDPESLADAFARATSGGARAAYLLSNPHNPTGTVHTSAELETLARLAADHGVTIISDEIHAALVYQPGSFTPYLTVPGAERGITVTSASKAWNLAGLKSGLIVPGAEAGAAVGRLHPFVTFGASHLGVIAHTAAWTHGGDWVRRLVQELDANRQLLAEIVADQLPRVHLQLPEATYLAWLDCRALDLGDNPAAWFRSHGRVALSEGPSFGEGGRGCARLNFATSPEILHEAVHRMAGSLG